MSIVCSCKVLTDKMLWDAIEEVGEKASVGTILKHVGAVPTCGTCAPALVDLVQKAKKEIKDAKEG